MSDTNILEFKGLEYQVDNLINLVAELKRENISLQQKLAHGIRERSKLQETNRRSALKIKKIIAQLRDEII